MPLFQQDLVRTNKRYVTKIVAQNIEVEGFEATTFGITSSAFAEFDVSGISAKDIKLHSVWATSESGGLLENGWYVRWGEDQTPNKGDGRDIVFLVGNDIDTFFEPRFSHKNTLEDAKVSVGLNNSDPSASRPINGTIILEFTI